MDESSCRPRMVDGDGAAKRRRQRRLRSWLRHEQQTVAAVLATVSHHSYPRVDTAHDGLRALKTVTSTREGVEHEKHVGLRAQKPPLPGVRPGSLLDPGPQRSDRTVRHSAGEVPLLVVASLADASADGVDAATLSFLTASALEARRKEEEERRKQEEQEFLNSLSAVSPERRTPLQNRRLTDILLHRAKRKRKKRRKRRTPRTSSLPGRARRRHRLWHVSLRHVVDVPVVRFVLVPQVLFFGFYADWISSNDEICADSFIYFRFQLKGRVAASSGRCCCTTTRPSRWTVIVWMCCPGVCLRLAFVVSALVLHPTWQRITPSMGCACLLSVAWI